MDLHLPFCYLFSCLSHNLAFLYVTVFCVEYFLAYSFYFSADISNCVIIVGIFFFTYLNIVLLAAFKISCLLIPTSGFFLDSVSILLSFWGWVAFSLFFILQGFWILGHSEYCVVQTVFCYIPLKNVDFFFFWFSWAFTLLCSDCKHYVFSSSLNLSYFFFSWNQSYANIVLGSVEDFGRVYKQNLGLSPFASLLSKILSWFSRGCGCPKFRFFD